LAGSFFQPREYLIYMVIKIIHPVLRLQASPIGPPQRVMVTMASSMAASTPTWCPTYQQSISKPSTIAIESNASKYDICCIDSQSFLPQKVLRETPTRNSRTSAAATAILLNDDDERPWPLTLLPHPPTAVDAMALSITPPPPLCNDVSFDYRLQLNKQKAELEQMHQRWLLMVVSLESSHLATDAHPNPPPNPISPDARIAHISGMEGVPWYQPRFTCP